MNTIIFGCPNSKWWYNVNGGDHSKWHVCTEIDHRAQFQFASITTLAIFCDSRPFAMFHGGVPVGGGAERLESSHSESWSRLK